METCQNKPKMVVLGQNLPFRENFHNSSINVLAQGAKILILAHWAKRHKMTVKKAGFCSGYNIVVFLCNGTDHIKFEQKHQIST